MSATTLNVPAVLKRPDSTSATTLSIIGSNNSAGPGGSVNFIAGTGTTGSGSISMTGSSMTLTPTTGAVSIGSNTTILSGSVLGTQFKLNPQTVIGTSSATYAFMDLGISYVTGAVGPTEASSLYLEGAPLGSSATTKYVFKVASGESYFGGPINISTAIGPPNGPINLFNNIGVATLNIGGSLSLFNGAINTSTIITSGSSAYLYNNLSTGTLNIGGSVALFNGPILATTVIGSSLYNNITTGTLNIGSSSMTGPLNITGGSFTIGSVTGVIGNTSLTVVQGATIGSGGSEVKWTTQSAPTVQQWNSICWSPELNLFVAVGKGGSPLINIIMTSSNGTTWTTQISPTAQNWKSVCWSSELGIFVAVSNSTSNNNPCVITSLNGTIWTSRTADTISSWNSVCWSPELSLFVAVGDNGTGTNHVMTSFDGIIWRAQIAVIASWNSICWSPEIGIFVAVSNGGYTPIIDVMTSSDGITWISQNSPTIATWISVCWSPEIRIFVSVASNGPGTNTVMKSSDGVLWTTQVSTRIFNSVCWSPQLKIFMGIGNNIFPCESTSSDGTTWTTQNATTPQLWCSVCWSAALGIFCVVSRSGTNQASVMTSTPISSTTTGINNNLTLGTQAASTVSLLGNTINVGQSATVVNIGKYAETINIGQTSDRTLMNGYTQFTDILSATTIVAPQPNIPVSIFNNISGGTITVGNSSSLTIFPGTLSIGGYNSTVTNVTFQSVTVTTVVISGASSFTGPMAINSTLYVTSQATFGGISASTIVAPSSTSNVSIFNNITTGTMTIGSLSMTGPFNINSGGALNISAITGTIANTPLITVQNAAISTWVTQPAATVSSWTSITWSPELSLFVAVANNGSSSISSVMTSSNGTTWTTQTSFTTASWNSVVWSPELGLFAAVSTNNNPSVMTSSDRITWVSQTASTASSWSEIAWSPELGIFCVISSTTNGNPSVMTSSNGTTWITQLAATTSSWAAITWSPELLIFCVVSSTTNGKPTVMTSSNGTTWTTQNSVTTSSWMSLAWSPELLIFAAVANNGSSAISSVMTSSNGTSWTTQNASTTQLWNSVTWSSQLKLFVAVGSNGSSSGVMTSSDGITWTTQSSSVSQTWQSVCWSASLGLFAAVSSSGTNIASVMTSTPITSTTGINNNLTIGTQEASITSLLGNTVNVGNNAAVVNIGKYSNNINIGQASDRTSINGYAQFTGVISASTISGLTPSSNVYLFNNSAGNITVGASNTINVITGTVNIGTTTITSNWSFNTFSTTTLNEVGTMYAKNPGIVTVNGTITDTSPAIFSGTIQVSTIIIPGNTGNVYSNLTSGSVTIGSGNAQGPLSISSNNFSINSTTANIGWTTLSTLQNIAGNSWIGVTMPSNTKVQFVSVVWAPELNIFCTLATTTNVNTNIMTSSDGINWITRTAATVLAWGNMQWSPQLNLFFAPAHISGAGTAERYDMLTSPDGITWTTRSSGIAAGWSATSWSPELGIFVALGAVNPGPGNAVGIYSSDGIKWNTFSGFSARNATGGGWEKMCWSPELGLFAACSSSTGDTQSQQIMTSPNGYTWTLRNTLATGSRAWDGICWSSELRLFVASGRGTNNMLSSDGITWTAAATQPQLLNWWSVCWSPQLSMFLSCAYDAAPNAVISYSNDGNNWTTVSPQPYPTTVAANNTWIGLCWSPALGKFCVVGQGTPTSNYAGMLTGPLSTGISYYTYTGFNQVYIPNTNTILVKIWGAGANGAVGGYSEGYINVTPGKSYYVVVGQALISATSLALYGGGGVGGGGVGVSGSGYSGIHSGIPFTQSNSLVIAGGASSRISGTDSGGNGGGTSGTIGDSFGTAVGGGGGTQSAGGTAGTVSGTPGGLGANGSALQGGAGGTGSAAGGGGGGGGYWGGGGGGGSTGTARSGGGGGSGYIGGTGVFNALTLTSSDNNNPPNSTDPYRIQTAGAANSNGLVVIIPIQTNTNLQLGTQASTSLTIQGDNINIGNQASVVNIGKYAQQVNIGSMKFGQKYSYYGQFTNGNSNFVGIIPYTTNVFSSVPISLGTAGPGYSSGYFYAPVSGTYYISASAISSTTSTSVSSVLQLQNVIGPTTNVIASISATTKDIPLSISGICYISASTSINNYAVVVGSYVSGNSQNATCVNINKIG